MKKLTTIVLIFCMIFMVTTPALARKGGGFKSGGFSKPKTTTTNPTSTPSTSGKTTEQSSGTTNTTNTTNQGTGDKIPYTNLPSSKVSQGAGAGAAAAGATSQMGRANFSGMRPSFSPFSGNFWFWMFLMNSFGHSQPAVAQTGENQTAATDQAQTQPTQGELYTPTMGDYWEADPLANTISTLLLVLVIGAPIMLFMRWRKKRRMSYR